MISNQKNEMTSNEKNDFLDHLEQQPALGANDFARLRILAKDSDSYIRGRLPFVLMNAVTEESLSLLMTLAADPDPLVRTEAYDSMSEFPFQQAVDLLYEAATKDPNSLARSYAIISWAELTRWLNQLTADIIEYADNQKNCEKSKRCLLSWIYALSLFKSHGITELLTFLKDKEDHLRRTALSYLSDLLDESNCEEIGQGVRALLEEETVLTVRTEGEKILQAIQQLR